MTSLTLNFRQHAGKVALALAATLAIIASTVLPAGAGQLANERAEAQELANRIAALGQQEAALGERYDAGVVALQLANARVRAAARALARAQAGQAHTTTLLQQDAVDAYVGGGPQMTLDASLPLDNLNDALFARSSSRPLPTTRPTRRTATAWPRPTPARPAHNLFWPATPPPPRWTSSNKTANRSRGRRTSS